jgi:hypothetical protein
MPRADQTVVRDFTSGLIADLDGAMHRTPYAGKPLIRRLNRTEYANAVRDLLAIELPLVAELPEDGNATPGCGVVERMTDHRSGRKA